MSGAAPGAPARTLAAALPDLALAVTFAIAWARPEWLDLRVLRWLPLVMLLEFIVMHSSGFVSVLAFDEGPVRRRMFMVGGLSAVYLLFALAFGAAFHSAWPVVSFVSLTLNRMAAVLLTPDGSAARRSLGIASWVGTAVLYLAGAVGSVALPLPRLGVTPDVVARMALPGGGEWIDRPWTVFAFGAFYFGLVGLAELLQPAWEPAVVGSPSFTTATVRGLRRR